MAGSETLAAYFEESAARSPESAALDVAGRSWSYREVRAAARGVAGLLRARGLEGARRGIGVLCDKSLPAYAGLLGILASGNVYLPLSLKHPTDRLLRILDDAR